MVTWWTESILLSISECEYRKASLEGGAMDLDSLGQKKKRVKKDEAHSCYFSTQKGKNTGDVLKQQRR